jgi:hypothetical protein
VPGLLAIIEGTGEEEVRVLEVELQETHLQQEAGHAAPTVVPATVPIPTGNAERVRAQAKLSRREQAAAAPGKKGWKILVRSEWDRRFPWKDIREDKESQTAKIYVRSIIRTRPLLEEGLSTSRQTLSQTTLPPYVAYPQCVPRVPLVS